LRRTRRPAVDRFFQKADNMAEITVRRADLGDAAGLAAFLKNLDYFPRLAPMPAEQVLAQVTRHLQLCLADASHSVYLAEDAQRELCGYTSVHWLPYLFLRGPEGYVSELFVARAARGQGVGTALLAAVKAEGRARGCARLSLLNMRERESYLRGFYAKDGWHEREDAANFVLDIST